MAETAPLKDKLADLQRVVAQIGERRRVAACTTRKVRTQSRHKADSRKRKAGRTQRRRRGGPGTELFRMYKSWGVTGCSRCSRLRRQMDAWGVAACREPENFEYIVADVMRRAPGWWKQQKPWVRARLWWQGNESVLEALLIAKDAAMEDIRAALRRQVEVHVRAAIAAAEQKGFA